MTDLEELKSVARDLHRKCSTDVVRAIADCSNLCDDSAGRVFIALGGAVAGMSSVSHLLASPECQNNLDEDSTSIAERALFGGLFAWFSEEPIPNKGGTKIIRQTIAAWEHITGKTFNPVWLARGVRNMIGAEGLQQ